MYKRIKGKKFSRKTDQRRAFLRNFATSLIMEEKITTTKTRARAVSSLVEKYITKAKKGGIAQRRILSGVLPEAAAKKLMSDLAARFASRQGGYTRIVRLGQRFKDGADMAVVEFVEKGAEAEKKSKKGGKKEKKTETKEKKEKKGKREEKTAADKD